MKKLTLAEVMKSYSDFSEQSPKDVRHAISVVAGLIEYSVMNMDKDEAFTLPDIGTFSVVESAERTGVNPRNGEVMLIPATLRVKFKPSATLKRAVKVDEE